MHRGTFNFRLVLNRVWHDIWDSCNSSHCLLTVRGWLRVVKIRAKCVRYLWLSCPVWPSRWVLCISMQWLRSKVCHDECVNGEICSLQHVGYQVCHVGSRKWQITKIWGPRCERDWFPWVNGTRDNGIWLYVHNRIDQKPVELWFWFFASIF